MEIDYSKFLPSGTSNSAPQAGKINYAKFLPTQSVTQPTQPVVKQTVVENQQPTKIVLKPIPIDQASQGIKQGVLANLPSSLEETVGGFLKGLVTPFVSAGVTVVNEAKNLAAAQKAVNSGQKTAPDYNAQSYTIPLYGKADPLFTGNENLKTGIQKIVGNGLEIAPYFLGVPEAKGLLSTIDTLGAKSVVDLSAKEALQFAKAYGTKIAASSLGLGTMFGLGGSIKQGASLKDTASNIAKSIASIALLESTLSPLIKYGLKLKGGSAQENVDKVISDHQDLIDKKVEQIKTAIPVEANQQVASSIPEQKQPIDYNKFLPKSGKQAQNINPEIIPAEAASIKISPELEPLAAEARKYKSAEEFVKAQGESLYHGTRVPIENRKGLFSLAEKSGIAENYAHGAGGLRNRENVNFQVEEAGNKNGLYKATPNKNGRLDYIRNDGAKLSGFDMESLQNNGQASPRSENAKIHEFVIPKDTKILFLDSPNTMNGYSKNTPGTKLLSGLDPQGNKFARAIVEEAKRGAFNWSNTKLAPYQEAWKKVLIPQLENMGYQGIKYADEGDMTTAVFNVGDFKTKPHLTDIYNQATTKPAEPKPLEPIGSTPSGVGKSIESKSIENGLTQGFQDIAGYDPITIKDQAQRAADLMNRDLELATKMVKGEVPMEAGLKGEMLIKAMEDHAQAKGDTQLLMDIAKSPLVSETSAHAQAMRILAERNPDSAVAKIQEISKQRQTNVEQRTKKTFSQAKKEVIDQIQTEMKKVKPKASDWASFIESIKC